MASSLQNSNQAGLEQVNIQVDEITKIMHDNRDKVLEREGKLIELNDKADQLGVNATEFESKAGQVRKKYWWENMKMKIIFACVGFIILAIIIILIVLAAKKTI